MRKSLEKSHNPAYNERSIDSAEDAAELLTTDAVGGDVDMAGSKSTKAPAFQFYPADFLSDPNVIGMSLAETGAYIRLICACWQQGSIPSDMSRLARICRVRPNVFGRLWPALEPCFQPHRNQADRLIQPRLEKERRKQAEYKRRQSDNGKLGGRPKKPTESHDKAVGFESETQALAKKSSSSLSSSSSSSSSSEKRGSPRRLAYCGERLDVTHGQHEWLCKEIGEYAAHIDILAQYTLWDQQRGPDDTDTLKYLKQRADESIKAFKRGGPLYSSLTNWLTECQHEPRCSSAAWHQVLLTRELEDA